MRAIPTTSLKCKISGGSGLPAVGGTYTMNADEAALAVSAIKPKVAVPIHWGSVCGSRADAEKFKKIAKCEVVILNKEN
jgi:L-ascorbate metabolism protein UlaG (beta-lactamase superfamily)